MPRLMIFGGGPRKVFTGVSGLGSSAASFDFLSMLYGDAAASRQLAIGIDVGTTGTNFAISSVSVDGNAASSVVNVAVDDSILKSRSAIYRLPLAATTGGTINVTLAGSVGQCQIAVWALYDLANLAAAFTATASAIDGNPVNTTIDMPASGLLLTTAHMFGASAAQTFTGSLLDSAQGTNSERQWGSYQAGAPETARALSFTGTAGVNSARTLAAASWN